MGFLSNLGYAPVMKSALQAVETGMLLRRDERAGERLGLEEERVGMAREKLGLDRERQGVMSDYYGANTAHQRLVTAGLRKQMEREDQMVDITPYASKMPTFLRTMTEAFPGVVNVVRDGNGNPLKYEVRRGDATKIMQDVMSGKNPIVTNSILKSNLTDLNNESKGIEEAIARLSESKEKNAKDQIIAMQRQLMVNNHIAMQLRAKMSDVTMPEFGTEPVQEGDQTVTYRTVGGMRTGEELGRGSKWKPETPTDYEAVEKKSLYKKRGEMKALGLKPMAGTEKTAIRADIQRTDNRLWELDSDGQPDTVEVGGEVYKVFSGDRTALKEMNRLREKIGWPRLAVEDVTVPGYFRDKKVRTLVEAPETMATQPQKKLGRSATDKQAIQNEYNRLRRQGYNEAEAMKILGLQ